MQEVRLEHGVQVAAAMVNHDSTLLTTILMFATIALACGPEPGDESASDSAGSSEGERTSTTTGPTTEEPTTTAPTTTTTTTTTTEEPTTEAGTTDEPAEVVACEQLPGPPGSAVDWYLRCGGLQSEYVNGVGTDAAGNIYLAVDLRVLEESSPLQIGEFEVTPGELSDILLIKLSSAGVPQWVRHFTGPGNQTPFRLISCGDGLVVEGFAEPGTVDLGGGPVDKYFIAAFDLDGNHRWSRSVPTIGRNSYVHIQAMTCDAAGALALTGDFHGAVDFGGGPIGGPEVYDEFVVTYDASGALQWVRQFNNADEGSVGGGALVFTPAGELVFAGWFDDTVDLGGGPLSSVEDDMLIVKYSATGEHVWSQQIGGAGRQYSTAIAADSAGRIALAGIFLDEVEIGDDKYINMFPDQIPSEDGTLYDGVLVQFDPDGVVQWSQHVGTMGNDRIEGLAFDAADTLLMTGFLADAFTLRALAGQETTLEWSTDQFARAHSARSGEDAVVIATSPQSADVDLGSGPLVDRGASDFVVARIRR